MSDGYTDREIQKEMQYRVQERLGSLCEDRVPTPKQTAIAEREAEQWRQDFIQQSRGELF